MAVSQKQTYRFAQDEKLKVKLKTDDVIAAPCSPNPETGQLIKGDYQLQLSGATFEPESNMDLEFVFHGQVYGLGRDRPGTPRPVLPLLWGTPVALAFGLIASLGTTVLTMIIAALGTWYGGWLDNLIQRITEVNLVLPFLSILIMVGAFYSAQHLGHSGGRPFCWASLPARSLPIALSFCR